MIQYCDPKSAAVVAQAVEAVCCWPDGQGFVTVGNLCKALNLMSTQASQEETDLPEDLQERWTVKQIDMPGNLSFLVRS